MNKKVGLVLAFKGTNYGALLQAYATQYIIERLGYETEIIDYMGKGIQYKMILKRGALWSILNMIVDKRRRAKINKKLVNPQFIINRNERKKISDDFRNRRLHRIVKLYDIKSLKEKSKEFDAVVIGSDQKWAPGACYGVLSSLSFVPKGVRRISYATSLGVSEYPKYCWYSSKKMWKEIDYLSVREEQGANIIKQICGDIDVSIVLDPTYLLTKEEWDELVPVEKLNEQKYLFCFFLGNDIESKKCARRYADEHKLQLVSLFSNESLSEIDQSYADKLVSGASPEDFINWVRGAECVFTDSFHGTAFSVINQKQFYVFYRKRDDVTQSRNSRIDNILSIWGLKDRLIMDKSIDWSSNKQQSIDYLQVLPIIEKKRAFSFDFLKRALTF